FLGNTSLQAAERVLTDADFFLHAKNIRDRMDSINLSSLPDFQREFLKALSFDTGQGGVL
ncbi:MAG: ASKHA domain-containing protein, partial [Smithella sp.]